MGKRSGLLLCVLALVAAACTDGGESGAADEQTTAAADTSTTVPDTTTAPYALPDYTDDAAAFIDAADDRSLPPVVPEGPTGAYGFSRYVYNQVDDEVLPTLIEGPRGQQYRCQDLERECSYVELKALHDSGEEVPAYLGMERAELGELVAQLDAVNAAIDEYPTLEEACAAGFTVSSSQNPNMGIHVQNPNGTTAEFDPGRPQMVLYAKEGGETLTQAEQGTCAGGEWTGEAGYESVGAVFTLLLSEEHPEGFAGPIDNWHIHFNTCAGSPAEGGADATAEAVEAGNRGAFSREQCEQEGGSFQEVIPVWMMHAYVEPENDAQGGVFAMFNPNIWPLAENPADIERLRTASLDGARSAPINNFDFGDITADVGESIVFSNSDSVPHTVTAGSPAVPRADFDSGVLGTGQTYEVSFSEPGAYALFCALHPSMTAIVTVE